MLSLLRARFHLSQVTVPRTQDHISHHRPLGLLLLLTVLVWQSGMLSTSAATRYMVPREQVQYVYFNSSPLTEDAWIGTRVIPRATTSTTSGVQSSVHSKSDTTWLGDFTQIHRPRVQPEIVLNAAPTIPIPESTVVYPYIPVQYTTPNGTPINNISPTYTPTPSVPFVNSVFGRSGIVVGQSGDYTTSIISEGSNMYYTQARFDSAFSGKTTTDLTEGSHLYFTSHRAQEALSGTIANISNNIWVLSGSLITTNSNLATATGDIATLSGGLATISTDILSLSGTLSNKIGLTALSTTGPLTYNNTTGVFAIGQATTSTNGYLSSTDWNTFNTKQNAMVQATTTASGWLSSTDWNTFNNKIGTIGTANGLSIAGTGISLALAGTSTTGALSATDWNTFNTKENVLIFGTGITRVGNTVELTNTGITFAIGIMGTDMNWSTAFTALGGTATLNIPDASLTARGLVSTGAQVFAGVKTFATAPTLSGFTLGSVLFASTGGLIAQDNNNFFFDAINKRLGIGTNAPSAKLHVLENTLTTTNLLTLTATGLTTGNALQIIGTGSRSLLRISQDSSDPLDVERVTIGQGGISATKPDSLARDQLYVFGRINTSWDHYIADFLGADVNRTTADGTTTDGLIWDSVGATPTWSVSNIIGISGARRIALSATVNASAFLGNYTNTQAGLNPVYESRAIINAANTTTRSIIGFSNRTQNNATLAVDTNNTTNEIFFRKRAASTTWEAVTRSTANATEVVTPTGIPVNQWNIFRIEVLDTARTARFYINGTLVATHSGTTIPASTLRIGHHMGMLVTAATLNTMDIDYIRMWSDDPASISRDDNTPGTASYVSDLFVPDEITPSLLETIEFATTSNTLKMLDSMIESTGTGIVHIDAGMVSSPDDRVMQDMGKYFLQILHAALERLSEVWLDMQLTLRSLVADEVKTEKLCLGETCITEDELKSLLQSRGVQSSSSSVSSGDSAPATEASTGSTDSGALVAPIDETPVETLPVDIVSTGSTDTILPLDPTPLVETTLVVDASGTVSP